LHNAPVMPPPVSDNPTSTMAACRHRVPSHTRVETGPADVGVHRSFTRA